MKVQALLKRTVSLFMAVSVCIGISTVSMAKSTYNDFEAITNHVNLKIPTKLSISRPATDITTTASDYFITGNSNPKYKLTMNGELVTTRGKGGSFGVYVPVESGKNVYTFKQGKTSLSLTITKGDSSFAPTTTVVSSMGPEYDCATFSGNKINLSCIAPSGGSVIATVGGRRVAMKQNVATAKSGVPAYYSASTTAGNVSHTRNLGPVTYTLTYNGKITQYNSEGSVFLAPKGGKLVVQVKNNAASIYKDHARSYFIETARLGAVDYVTDIGNTSYQLSSGGWIPKSSVVPLTGNVSVNNNITDVSYQIGNKGEQLVLSGTSAPFFRAYQQPDKLTVKLFHTNGIPNFTLNKSKLFSEVNVTKEGDATTLVFSLSGRQKLWGYDIKYDKGVTTIYAKYAPTLSSSSQPLSGITVALDAGHGGADPGAIGIPGTDGPMEKDINLDTSIAVQKRLESLGATVIQLRSEDTDLSLNDRMTMTQDVYADFFISLHCNSIGYQKNSNTAVGSEVFYYENIAKNFASVLSGNVASYTGRKNRGALLSNYRVTLNTFAPSVLVELGFMTCAQEYDDLISKTSIFNTANAVGDSLIAVLR